MHLRYHATIGFPSNVRLPRGRFLLKPAIHALREAKADGMSIPRFISLTGETDVFELATDPHGKLLRIAVRVPADHNRDLCMVIDVTRAVWIVVTVWTNHQNDRHITLDRTVYAVPH
jgi:hypothetical protein